MADLLYDEDLITSISELADDAVFLLVPAGADQPLLGFTGEALKSAVAPTLEQYEILTSTEAGGGPATPTSITAFLDAYFGMSTVGASVKRGASSWEGSTSPSLLAVPATNSTASITVSRSLFNHKLSQLTGNPTVTLTFENAATSGWVEGDYFEIILNSLSVRKLLLLGTGITFSGIKRNTTSGYVEGAGHHTWLSFRYTGTNQWLVMPRTTMVEGRQRQEYRVLTPTNPLSGLADNTIINLKVFSGLANLDYIVICCWTFGDTSGDGTPSFAVQKNGADTGTILYINAKTNTSSLLAMEFTAGDTLALRVIGTSSAVSGLDVSLLWTPINN